MTAPPEQTPQPTPTPTQAPTPVPMVQLEQVSLTLGRAEILSSVDLRVEPGTSLGIIGPAACGKSLLLKLIAGLLPPTAGAVRIAGQDIAKLDEAALVPIRRNLGMLFQNDALFDFMTVGENVAFPLVRRGELSPDEIAQRVAERLRMVGLEGTADASPSALSGGMKRRVGIARATVHRPDLVIYDEPTAGLDPVTTSKMYELIRAEQAETGCTVIAVSSDALALAGFADRIAMLYGGTIHHEGPAGAIADADDPVVRQFVRGELDGPL